MRPYKTKSKLFGYQIGLNNDSLYVAVPSKYFKDNNSVEIQVVDGLTVEISKTVIESDSEQSVTLKDKFKQDQDYQLLYFKVKEF